MRMFVAIRPSEEAVADLDTFLDVRREHGAFRWTDPEHFHLTLAFCEHVAERSLDELIDRLAAMAERTPSFDLRLSGGGAFPNVALAKVLWVGGEAPEGPLRRLAAGSRGAANAAGIRVDGARFHPHVTVARTGWPIEATSWIRVLDTYRGPVTRVEQVELVASYLGEGRRRRPRYETIAQIPLSD
ncbi:MAG TPA: RNA 2',3'-cyclic phosphodiesterase [Marmoricola sp.]|nr:RNA 2',3'-cyclic phosphodiesterase [Marmoricola sp.]